MKSLLIKIDDRLHKQLKLAAAETDTTIKAFIIRAIDKHITDWENLKEQRKENRNANR